MTFLTFNLKRKRIKLTERFFMRNMHVDQLTVRNRSWQYRYRAYFFDVRCSSVTKIYVFHFEKCPSDQNRLWPLVPHLILNMSLDNKNNVWEGVDEWSEIPGICLIINLHYLCKF